MRSSSSATGTIGSGPSGAERGTIDQRCDAWIAQGRVDVMRLQERTGGDGGERRAAIGSAVSGTDWAHDPRTAAMCA